MYKRRIPLKYLWASIRGIDIALNVRAVSQAHLYDTKSFVAVKIAIYCC